MGIEGRRLFLQQCAGVGALGGSRAQRDARGDYSVAHSVSTPGCIAIGITVAWYLACARGAISRRSAQRHTQTVGLCCSAVQCFAPPRVRIIVAGEVVRWLCGGRSVGFLSFRSFTTPHQTRLQTPLAWLCLRVQRSRRAGPAPGARPTARSRVSRVSRDPSEIAYVASRVMRAVRARAPAARTSRHVCPRTPES